MGEKRNTPEKEKKNAKAPLRLKRKAAQREEGAKESGAS